MLPPLSGGSSTHCTPRPPIADVRECVDSQLQLPLSKKPKSMKDFFQIDPQDYPQPARQVVLESLNPLPSSSLAIEAVDSHCHVDRILSFILHKGEQLSLQTDVYLSGVVANFCDPETYKLVYSFISKLPQFWIAVGIHPKKVRYNNPGILAELEQLLAIPNVVGLSELGVDYTSDPKSWELQWEFVEYVLKRRLQGLVLILHVRTSPVGPPEEEVYTRLRQLLLSHCNHYQFIHFHNYTGTTRQMHEWLQSIPNICFGVSGLMRHFGQEQKEMLRQIPRERLLLKTDSP